MIFLLTALALVQSSILLDKPLVDRRADERPALLVIASPHLANNFRDVVNVRIDDVQTPTRQREIARLADAIARFRPTRIAVEWRTSKRAELDTRYADYQAGRYALSASEIDQLGLRIAANRGLSRVDAVDWNGMPPGVEADYNYLTYAAANGLTPRFEVMKAKAEANAKTIEARQRCTDVADWYRRLNRPETLAESNRRYYDFALLGGEETNPGATWVGNWHARNLKIFANLVRIAPNPKDRILVIYGAGHAPLLRQFAQESGAFAVADAADYLPEPDTAKRAGCP